MTELIIILAPIALLDSTSLVPLCIVVLIVVLTGPRPVLTSAAFISGIYAVYFTCGLLLLFGLQSVFDQLNEYATRLWQNPNTEELALQIVLGVVLCAFGTAITRRRKRVGEQPAATGMTPSRALITGASLTIMGLPGAIPYFAAIDLVLRADAAAWQWIMALVYYNLIFVVPIIAIVTVGLAFGERGIRVQNAIRRFLDQWGERVIVTLLLILGIVLILDGVGWFLGYPIIPV